MLNYIRHHIHNSQTQHSLNQTFFQLIKPSPPNTTTMFKTAFLFAGLALSINAQVSAPANSLELGQTCSDDSQCKNGVNCYGTTSDTIRACGNFNAACTDDSQCAFNTCASNGLCSGFLAQSSSASTTNTVSTSTEAPPSIITGTAGSQPSGQAPITAAAGSLELGETCSDDRQCKNGANCYGTTAFTIRSCGNFNAACDNDSQCAFNTCASNGLCSGFRSQSSSSSSASTTLTEASPSIITGTAGSQPSGQAPITAAVGSLNLGDICSDSKQCKNGADCFGTTAFTIRRCGNYNAACDNDSQCAYNTCAGTGLCNGFLETRAVANGTMTTSTFVAAATGGYTGVGNGSAVATATGGMKPSGSGVPFEGSASSMGVAGGVVAVLAGMVVFVI
jgi:hypothetical protein